MIKEAAQRAAAKIGKIQPYRVEGPVTIEIEYTTRNSLRINAGEALGGEVVDDRTIRYRGKDFFEALDEGAHVVAGAPSQFRSR